MWLLNSTASLRNLPSERRGSGDVPFASSEEPGASAWVLARLQEQREEGAPPQPLPHRAAGCKLAPGLRSGGDGGSYGGGKSQAGSAQRPRGACVQPGAFLLKIALEQRRLKFIFSSNKKLIKEKMKK